MSRAIPIEVREMIVDAYFRDQGTIAELAQVFNISTRVIDKFLSLSRDNKDLIPGKSSGRPGKITEAEYPKIKKMVQKNPDKTLIEYCEIVFLETGISVGTSIMDRTFKKLNIRRKKKSYYASEQERPDVKKKRRFYSRVRR